MFTLNLKFTFLLIISMTFNYRSWVYRCDRFHVPVPEWGCRCPRHDWGRGWHRVTWITFHDYSHTFSVTFYIFHRGPRDSVTRGATWALQRQPGSVNINIYNFIWHGTFYWAIVGQNMFNELCKTKTRCVNIWYNISTFYNISTYIWSASLITFTMLWMKNN